MNKEDYVSLEVAELLKNIGFDELTDSMYADIYRVSDKMQKEYPNLSDSGVRDLLKENGGNMDENEVYSHYREEVYINCKNSDIAHGKSLETMICSRPTLYQAQKWLRNNFNVHVNVMCTDYDDKLNKCKYNCSVVNFDKNLFQTSKTSYSYEETLNSGILLAIISTINS